MIILKDDMERLLVEVKYIKRREFQDDKLNDYLHYWSFLEEKEGEILGLVNESLDVILYSKFYWCSRFKERYTKMFGVDVGVEQQHYKIIEEIDQRIDGGIDWRFIEPLEVGEEYGN